MQALLNMGHEIVQGPAQVFAAVAAVAAATALVRAVMYVCPAVA